MSNKIHDKPRISIRLLLCAVLQQVKHDRCLQYARLKCFALSVALCSSFFVSPDLTLFHSMNKIIFFQQFLYLLLSCFPRLFYLPSILIIVSVQMQTSARKNKNKTSFEWIQVIWWIFFNRSRNPDHGKLDSHRTLFWSIYIDTHQPAVLDFTLFCFKLFHMQ